MTTLIEATDDDFEWMLRAKGESVCGLRLPPGGVDDPAVLTYLRGHTQELRTGGWPGTWMFASGGELVGLGGYKRLPQDGIVEIGYGVAGSRRSRGHATRAVAAMLEVARASGIHTLLAETVVENSISGRVLERNGFQRTGMRTDAEGATLITWRRVIA